MKLIQHLISDHADGSDIRFVVEHALDELWRRELIDLRNLHVQIADEILLGLTEVDEFDRRL